MVINMFSREYDQELEYAVRRREAIEEGREEGRFEIAKKLITMGLSAEEVAKVTGLSLEEIKNLD